MGNLKTNIIILIIICFGVLYISLKDNFATVMGQIYEVNFWWFLLACLLMMMYFLFRAIEMTALVRLVDKGYSYRKALGIVVIGQFFANVTPSSVGTQPAQIFFLSKDRIKGSNGTRIVVQYNITYQIALLIISVITIMLAYQLNIFGDMSSTLVFKELVLISFLIHFGVLIVLLAVNFSKETNRFVINKIISILAFLRIVKNKKEAVDNWAFYLHDFHEGSSNLFKNKRLLVKGIVCNLLAIMCMYSIPLLLLYAIGDFNSLKLMGTNIAASYTNIVSSFIPSPGGTGGFEYFFTQYFGVFIAGATLTTLMLLWRMVTYYFVLLVGSIMLIFYKEGTAEL